MPRASATTSARRAGHQRAVSLQRLRPTTVDRLEGRPGDAVERRLHQRHAVAAGQRGAVARVTVEELEHPPHLAEPGEPVLQALAVDRVDQPHAALVGQGVGGPRMKAGSAAIQPRPQSRS